MEIIHSARESYVKVATSFRCMMVLVIIITLTTSFINALIPCYFLLGVPIGTYLLAINFGVTSSSFAKIAPNLIPMISGKKGVIAKTIWFLLAFIISALYFLWFSFLFQSVYSLPEAASPERESSGLLDPSWSEFVGWLLTAESIFTLFFTLGISINMMAVFYAMRNPKLQARLSKRANRHYTSG